MKKIIALCFLYALSSTAFASEAPPFTEHPHIFPFPPEDDSFPLVFHDNCEEYETGAFFLLGDLSPIKSFHNCLSKFIDEDLTKLCAKERLLKMTLENYKTDQDIIGGIMFRSMIELRLDKVGEKKYQAVDEIYDISDMLDEQIDIIMKDIETKKEDSFVSQLLSLVLNSDIRTYHDVVGSKLQNACPIQLSDASEMDVRK